MHINGSYRDHEAYYLLNPGAVTKNQYLNSGNYAIIEMISLNFGGDNW